MEDNISKIRFVVATRENEENFHKNTLTVKTIKIFNFLIINFI